MIPHMSSPEPYRKLPRVSDRAAVGADVRVRPCDPPGLAVTVGDETVPLRPSHVTHPRVDVIYRTNGMLGIAHGYPAMPPAPMDVPDTHALACVLVQPNATAIWAHDITRPDDWPQSSRVKTATLCTWGKADPIAFVPTELAEPLAPVEAIRPCSADWEPDAVAPAMTDPNLWCWDCGCGASSIDDVYRGFGVFKTPEEARAAFVCHKYDLPGLPFRAAAKPARHNPLASTWEYVKTSPNIGWPFLGAGLALMCLGGVMDAPLAFLLMMVSFVCAGVVVARRTA